MARSAPSHPVDGRFGAYGGQYVPETLMSALLELEDMWHEAKADTQSLRGIDTLSSGGRRRFMPRRASVSTLAAPTSTSNAKTCATRARTS